MAGVDSITIEENRLRVVDCKIPCWLLQQTVSISKITRTMSQTPRLQSTNGAGIAVLGEEVS